MSIYNRDSILPEWEPAPWPMGAAAADVQEAGFHRRAIEPLQWHKIPAEGVFGHDAEWLSSVDATHFALFGGEDLLLIDNAWSGWPDPPRWGLASRPHGQDKAQWTRWGHFAFVPSACSVPSP